MKKKFRTNPFLFSTALNTKAGNRIITGTGTGVNLKVYDEQTNEVGTTGFYQKYEVDKTAFIKLYAGGIKALLGLKPAGVKVFSLLYKYLLDDSMYERDRIILDYNALEPEESQNISQAVWFRGINNLIENELIACSITEKVYWINPNFIYRGNRLALVKEYILGNNEHKEVNNPNTLNPNALISDEGGVKNDSEGAC